MNTQNEKLEAGDLYLFGDRTSEERLWGIFHKRDAQGRIVLEAASPDFEHFERDVIVPGHWFFVRPATRDELRDFAYNMGYAHF